MKATFLLLYIISPGMYYLLLTVSFPSFFFISLTIIALKKKKLLRLWFFLAVGETQLSFSFFFSSFYSSPHPLPLLFVVDWVVFPRLWRSRDTAGLITCMCIRREVLGANSQLTPARAPSSSFFFFKVYISLSLLCFSCYFVLLCFSPFLFRCC